MKKTHAKTSLLYIEHAESMYFRHIHIVNMTHDAIHNNKNYNENHSVSTCGFYC